MESLEADIRNTNDVENYTTRSPHQSSSSRPRLRISRLTSSSIPTLAEANILAYLPDKIVSTRMNPNRWTLRDSGVPVREWTDYHETMERFERARVGEGWVFVCNAEREGYETPIGMVVMSLPGTRDDRTWTDWMLGDYIYPMMKALGIAERKMSMNSEFLGMFVKSAEETRKRLMKEREYATIDELFTDPASHGTGAGSFLLNHCIALATSKNLPILLESSEAGFEFYKKRGFKQIGEGRFVYEGEEVKWPVMLRECGQED